MKCFETRMEPNGALLTGFCYETSVTLPESAAKPAVLVFPGGAYMHCVDRPGKDESELILSLRRDPEKLKTLELTMEELLTLASPFMSNNIKRHVNAALQQIKQEA